MIDEDPMSAADNLFGGGETITSSTVVGSEPNTETTLGIGELDAPTENTGGESDPDPATISDQSG